MVQALVLRGSLGGRAVRTAALVGLHLVTLLLGAAGAGVLAGDGAPGAWLNRVVTGQASQESPATGTVPCGDVAAASGAAGSSGDLSVADVAELVNPAVVTITNLQGGGFGDQNMAVGAGSGFIIDGEGRVITNNHVVAGADELSVEFLDGTVVPATVVGGDELQDVAVIQLDLTDGVELPGIATLGDSNTVRPGDRVVAIGSALGEFTNTVTEGTVGAVDRSLGGYGLSNLIQHDAPIWRGNSGGPLINLRGEVIGINSAGLDDERSASDLAPAQLAFAIEIDAAREVADELIANGVVARPYLGIQGAPTSGGHLVDSVEADGPAAAAGLAAGDVIVAIDGQAINRQTSLLDLLMEREPGDTVTLTVERDGAEQTIQVVLGQRPAATE